MTMTLGPFVLGDAWDHWDVVGFRIQEENIIFFTMASLDIPHTGHLVLVARRKHGSEDTKRWFLPEEILLRTDYVDSFQELLQKAAEMLSAVYMFRDSGGLWHRIPNELKTLWYVPIGASLSNQKVLPKMEEAIEALIRSTIERPGTTYVVHPVWGTATGRIGINRVWFGVDFDANGADREQLLGEIRLLLDLVWERYPYKDPRVYPRDVLDLCYVFTTRSGYKVVFKPAYTEWLLEWIYPALEFLTSGPGADTDKAFHYIDYFPHIYKFALPGFPVGGRPVRLVGRKELGLQKEV